MYDQARIHRLAEEARHSEEGFEALVAAMRPVIRRALKQFYDVAGHGLTRDDFEQEARLGLWYATLDWDGVHPFVPFAHVCIVRNMVTALKTATRLKHRAVNEAMRFEHPARAESDGLERLADVVPCRRPTPHEEVEQAARTREVLAGIAELSPLERRAVELVAIQGRSYEVAGDAVGAGLKSIDNALQRARRKLAA